MATVPIELGPLEAGGLRSAGCGVEVLVDRFDGIQRPTRRLESPVMTMSGFEPAVLHLAHQF